MHLRRENFLTNQNTLNKVSLASYKIFSIQLQVFTFILFYKMSQ